MLSLWTTTTRRASWVAHPRSTYGKRPSPRTPSCSVLSVLLARLRTWTLAPPPSPPSAACSQIGDLPGHGTSNWTPPRPALTRSLWHGNGYGHPRPSVSSSSLFPSSSTFSSSASTLNVHMQQGATERKPAKPTNIAKSSQENAQKHRKTGRKRQKHAENSLKSCKAAKTFG
ncbi:hypothetical protein DFH06DRAFT_1206888 [Mycena polygramma]|nr:hypothetical protein DFH06DRAFT_1206888 [Mycena polygramma]